MGILLTLIGIVAMIGAYILYRKIPTIWSYSR